MALTAGFKKFLGLIAVAAVVGGGIYYYKHMPKAAPTEDVAVTAPAETAQTAPTETAPTTAEANPNASVRPNDPEPEAAPAETTPPKHDASANRGLNAVLNAGKK